MWRRTVGPLCWGGAHITPAKLTRDSMDIDLHCTRGHGPLVAIPVTEINDEQRWCGTWYRCTHANSCTVTALDPSEELRALHDQACRTLEPA